jgi:hypothetical protein
MSRPLPWAGISLPATDYNVKLVAGALAVPVYWGRDPTGRCLLIVDLHGDHTNEFRRDRTSIHGIDVDLRNSMTPGQQRLVLTLDQSIDQDLFLGLCETLIASLTAVPDSATAVSVALAHIRRWKAFLAGRKTRLLSPQEVRGLFAELQMMRALYATCLTARAAVGAWGADDDTHQDYIFGNTAIEVKSLSGRDRSTVRISSEDQLESVLDELYLVVYRLTENPAATASLSLNQLVREIEHELGDADAMEQFSAKLAAVGYAPLPDYDQPRFVVSAHQPYRVRGEFPRLVRSQLPGGIARLSYEIEIEAMKAFECTEEEVLGG